MKLFPVLRIRGGMGKRSLNEADNDRPEQQTFDRASSDVISARRIVKTRRASDAPKTAPKKGSFSKFFNFGQTASMGSGKDDSRSLLFGGFSAGAQPSTTPPADQSPSLSTGTTSHHEQPLQSVSEHPSASKVDSEQSKAAKALHAVDEEYRAWAQAWVNRAAMYRQALADQEELLSSLPTPSVEVEESLKGMVNIRSALSANFSAILNDDHASLEALQHSIDTHRSLLRWVEAHQSLPPPGFELSAASPAAPAAPPPSSASTMAASRGPESLAPAAKRLREHRAGGEASPAGSAAREWAGAARHGAPGAAGGGSEGASGRPLCRYWDGRAGSCQNGDRCRFEHAPYPPAKAPPAASQPPVSSPRSPFRSAAPSTPPSLPSASPAPAPAPSPEFQSTASAATGSSLHPSTPAPAAAGSAASPASPLLSSSAVFGGFAFRNASEAAASPWQPPRTSNSLFPSFSSAAAAAAKPANASPAASGISGLGFQWSSLPPPPRPASSSNASTPAIPSSNSSGSFLAAFGASGAAWKPPPVSWGGGTSLAGAGQAAVADADGGEDGEGWAEGEVAIEKGSGIVELQEVDTKTGEEEEETKLSLPTTKLYEYRKESPEDKAGDWKVKGLGALKLNVPKEEGQEERRARVLMRRAGNLEVMLNSNLFPGMAANKGGEKGVIFTGAREGELVTYLVKCQSKADADKLLELIRQFKPEAS